MQSAENSVRSYLERVCDLNSNDNHSLFKKFKLNQNMELISKIIKENKGYYLKCLIYILNPHQSSCKPKVKNIISNNKAVITWKSSKF